MERHTCLETFLELYEIILHCLDAIVNITELSSGAETATKANKKF